MYNYKGTYSKMFHDIVHPGLGTRHVALVIGEQHNIRHNATYKLLLLHIKKALIFNVFYCLRLDYSFLKQFFYYS